MKKQGLILSFSLLLSFFLISFSYSNDALVRRLSNKVWENNESLMVFSSSGRELAVSAKNKSSVLGDFKSLSLEASIDNDAGVFRWQGKYLGIRIDRYNNLLTYEGFSLVDVASEFKAGASYYRAAKWHVAGPYNGSVRAIVDKENSKNSPFPRLAGKVWTNKESLLVFSPFGRELSIRTKDLNSLSNDFKSLYLEEHIDKNAWVFRWQGKYLGIRIDRDNNLLTYEGASLGDVSTELKAGASYSRSKKWSYNF